MATTVLVISVKEAVARDRIERTTNAIRDMIELSDAAFGALRDLGSLHNGFTSDGNPQPSDDVMDSAFAAHAAADQALTAVDEAILHLKNVRHGLGRSISVKPE